MQNNFNNKIPINPHKLKKGDTIGIISPAGSITHQQLETTIANMKKFGFIPFPGKFVLNKKGFLAGSDTQRAADINNMFENKNVAGIICSRGGYGTTRLLHLLDYSIIKQNPKPIMGHSDITALLNAIHFKTGLITFHSPMGISSFNEQTIKYFKKVLMNPEREYSIFLPRKPGNEEEKAFIINEGKASGILAGGNLSLLVSLIGTPFDIDYKDKIIFIEEINEAPYRIDRMLTQLIASYRLTQAAGIACGVFTKCDSDNSTYNNNCKTVLMERLSNLNIPAVYGFQFGHIPINATMPIGSYVLLNTYNQSLTFFKKPGDLTQLF